MNLIKNIKIPKYLNIAAFAVIVFTLLLRLLGSFIDPDMWWHVILGKQIINSQWINTLTYTCTDFTWINHSWLSDVLINAINSVFGFYGLSIFFAIVFVLGIGFSLLTLKYLLKQNGIINSRFNTLMYILFFILLLSSFIAIRPQVFTFLFFNALIYILIRFYYSKKVSYKSIIAFVLFFILWVNLHGGFIIGMALVGLFLLDTFFNFLRATFSSKHEEAKLLLSKSKLLFLLVILFFVASLINPFGLNLWKEVFGTVLGGNAQFIMEWKAINLKDYFNLFFFLIFLAALILQIINKKRNSIRLILLIPFACLSFYSVRYILPVSGIVLLVTFVEANIFFKNLQRYVFKEDKDLQRLLGFLKYLLIIVIATVASIGAYIGLSFFLSLGDFNVADNHVLYPIEAKKYLEANKEKYKNYKFYNTYVWGGYLEYSLPDFKWIIDGRMAVWQCEGKVKKDVMLDYMEVERLGPKWKEVLNQYGVEMLIIGKDGTLANILSADFEWQILYTDNTATIFIRK